MGTNWNKVFITTMGCAKNWVDSENMLGIMESEGLTQTLDVEEAEIGIVNTCGFIDSAKEESIQEILSLAQYKEIGNLKKLIVTGCLAQRYSKELMEEIPEIDFILGTTSFPQIMSAIKMTELGKRDSLLEDINLNLSENMERTQLTEEYYAYLKIAEGCDNLCTYCIIPKLRGKYRSRQKEDIVEESKKLAESGVKELIVIAQDTTKYGIDLYGKKSLGELLKELDNVKGLHWIRVLYSYPEDIDDEFILAVKNSKKIIPYFDMPIQHCSDTVLKRMNRHTSKQELYDKVNQIRTQIPNAVLRTTLITGFPGETREEFEELKQFVQEVKFDRLGVFAFSQEEGTPAAKMKDQIEEQEKENRRAEIMNIQQAVSFEK
ncbi:MAG: 30S ribosomal protein S12 methylthiotransferase RimO, partial [Filifactor alocis]